MAVLDWLLDSDPAIRWQVLSDLVHAPADVVAAERARVASEGWGARLLALQGEDGQWAGGRGHCRWEHAGQPFFGGEVEPCINGRTVALGTYFDQEMEGVVARLRGDSTASGSLG